MSNYLNSKQHKRKFFYSYISEGVTVSGHKWARSSEDVFQSLREYEEHHYRSISRLRIVEDCFLQPREPQLTGGPEYPYLIALLVSMLIAFLFGLMANSLYSWILDI